MDDPKRGKDGGTAARPVRRPMNAFLIFCKRHRSLVREKNPQLDNRSVTRILGELWANLPMDDKAQYINSAKQYKEEFMKVNPNYKWYNPEKHNTVNSAKPATRPSNAFIVYHGEKPHTIDMGITPGKLADPSCMGGLSLLLMAGQQTLHAHGHNSKNSGHDSQTPGHNSQLTSHDTNTDTLTRSVGKKPLATDETMSLADKDKKNTALLQLAEMCTSRLNDKTKEGVDTGTGQPSSTHLPSGQMVRSAVPTPHWTSQHEAPPPSSQPQSPPLTLKDSPMDLSNKKHESVSHQQTSHTTWRGTATEHHLVDGSRVSEALDLTVPSSKPSFTELNIPCRKPVTKDQSKPRDGKPPGGSKEKQSRCGSTQKSVGSLSGQNFTISGQNVVDKVLESLYYHMNSQNATGDDTKTCSFRGGGSTMKRRDAQQKTAPTTHQKVSEPTGCESVESTNRDAAARKRYARPPDGSHVKPECDVDYIPAVPTTFKVSDIKPSMTFGEIQETLIRRAVEAPCSLLSGSVRRFSTGSASRAGAVARSTASACRRTASTSNTSITQNALLKNVETGGKEGLSGCGVSQTKEVSQETENKDRTLAEVTDVAGNLSSWQRPLPLDSAHQNIGKESCGRRKPGDTSPPKEESDVKEEGSGQGTVIVKDVTGSAGDNSDDTTVKCDTKDVFSFPDDQESTECHLSGGTKPGDSLVTNSAASPPTKVGLSTRKNRNVKPRPQNTAESLRWKTQPRKQEPKRETKNILKETNKDEVTEHREDQGMPLKKRRIKVDEWEVAECNNKPAAAKRRRRCKTSVTPQPPLESNDSSSCSSPIRSEDHPPQSQGVVASPPEGADGSSGGVRKSQRSNRGKKYQELISQGLIQPSRNGSRRQEVSDDHRTKVDGDFVPAASGIVGSRRSRKRALSEASAGHDDTSRRSYKTGSFDLDACIASLPVCDLVFAKKSAKPVGGTPCPSTKTVLSEPKEGTDLNIVEVRRLTKHQPQSETDSETRLSGSQKRKARKCSITHLLECRSSSTTNTTATVGATSPTTPSQKSPEYLENNNNNSSQVAPPFSNVIVPVTATIATCSIGLGLLEGVTRTEEHQSLPAGDAIATSSTSTAIFVT